MGQSRKLPEGVYAYTTKSGETRYRVAYSKGSGAPSTKRGFTSSRAASRWRQNQQSAVRRGEAPDTPREAFGSLFDRFLDARRAYLQPGTVSDYETHGPKRLKPAFGGLRLDHLTAARIEDWLVDLYDEGELAPKTANNALKVLSAVLAWSVERGYLVRNPASGVGPLPEGHDEMDYLRPEEVPLYLEACTPGNRPLAELLIGSGLRISEALGLEWDDLDVEHGIVRVLRQHRRGAQGRRGGQRIAGAAQTKGNSCRQVHISLRVMAILCDLRARQGEMARVRANSKVFSLERMPRLAGVPASRAARARRAAIAEDLQAAGRPGATSQAEIAQRHGVSQQLVSLVQQEMRAGELTPISRDLVSRSWHKRALRAAGVRDTLRLHDLRHTAAALWQMGGESLYFVQRQLGHRSSKTTERYAHLERGYMTGRASEIDALMWARHRSIGAPGNSKDLGMKTSG